MDGFTRLPMNEDFERAKAHRRVDRVDRLLAEGNLATAESELLSAWAAFGRAVVLDAGDHPRSADSLLTLLERCEAGWITVVLIRLLTGSLQEWEIEGYSRLLRSELGSTPRLLEGSLA